MTTQDVLHSDFARDPMQRAINPRAMPIVVLFAFAAASPTYAFDFKGLGKV
jgi:hypothetical protein